MKNLACDWTVAIVDDQPDARELLTYALRATYPRIQIMEPNSPGWLLDHLHERPVEAVVTRYKLFGGMDGLLFSALLRSAGFSGPIIMVSNSEEIANQIDAAGINEFISFERWSELPTRLALQLQKQAADSAVPESA
ncbi:MAG TPA: response regulator [Opitutaceae bacterium]